MDRLCEQVKANLSPPFDFVVLDETNVDFTAYPGWWSKIHLFEPGRFQGRVLYLDLDVCVTGDLGALVDFDAPFAAPRDPLYIGFNSSVMVWDSDAVGLTEIWRGPPSTWRQWQHGDQRWIWHCMHGVGSFLPQRWCTSYKAGLYYGQWPSDQRVVYFHGLPKPWDVERPYPWEPE